MGLPHAETSDVLQYLRKTTLWNLRNKEVVYSGRSDSLYLVIQGHVLLLHTVLQELVIRFVPPAVYCNDSCLVYRDGAWKREDIERQIQMEPLLGVALLKYAVD